MATTLGEELSASLTNITALIVKAKTRRAQSAGAAGLTAVPASGLARARPRGAEG
jgi:hypothetical protein